MYTVGEPKNVEHYLQCTLVLARKMWYLSGCLLYCERWTQKSALKHEKHRRMQKWIQGNIAYGHMVYLTLPPFNARNAQHFGLINCVHEAIIGTSLSGPHTSVTAFHICVCLFACLLACLWPYTANFKWAHSDISRRHRERSRIALPQAHCWWRATGRAKCQRKRNPEWRWCNTCMATVDHDRWGQAAHRWYKLCTVVEFASG